MRYYCIKNIIAGLSLLLAFVCADTQTYAQLPTCIGNSGMVYMVSSHQVYNYDPSKPISATNPSLNTITTPTVTSSSQDGVALAVSPNLNGAGPSPTFYTNAAGRYYYYNGSTWINTGHTYGGAVPLFNFGAGGGYIYSYDNGTGNVYRYDGTSNAVPVLNIGVLANAPDDIVADCSGNFYLLNPSTPQFFRKYSPTGTLLNSWTINGLASNTNGGGSLAMIADTVFFAESGSSTSLRKGVLIGNTLDFSLFTPVTIFGVSDFATCPTSSTVAAIQASIDTGYYCGNGPGVAVTATGSGPFTWSVLSGPATINGSGSSVTVTSSAYAKILLTGTPQPCMGSNTDTVTILVPTATVSAGIPDTIYGCGSYIDTLNGFFNYSIPWIKYNIAWSPANTITLTPNPLRPIIQQTGNTTYTLTVSTGAAQGGCTWQDTVQVATVNASIDTTDFTFGIRYGCGADTVIFSNKTVYPIKPGTSYWDFGDFSPISAALNPLHVYHKAGSYNVVLAASNKYCSDTISKLVTVSHPLDAAFKIDRDSFCKRDTLHFDAGISVINAVTQPIAYAWDFADGNIAAGVLTSHFYIKDTTYDVRLVLSDIIPCYDTVYRTVYPDNSALPSIELGNDTTLCEGETMYLPLGLIYKGEKFLWQDGSTDVKHYVEAPGVYRVKISNQCGEAYDTIKVGYQNCYIWFPGAFSPNGDGLNDLARLRGSLDNITACSISIYDRWGIRVFHTGDKNAGWDGRYKGTLQPIETYYYMITYAIKGVTAMMKGDITLVQ